MGSGAERNWGRLALTAIGVALALHGCRSGIQTCEPGETRTCAACPATQECGPDGTFGPCDCATGGVSGSAVGGTGFGGSTFGGSSGSSFGGFGATAGSFGRGGSGAKGGTGGAGGFNSPLGRSCSSNNDCDGFECLMPGGAKLGGGGPAGGYCSYPCQPESDDCQYLGFGAECIDFGTPGNPNGYCMQGCARSGSEHPPFDPAKCHGRGDRACSEVFQPVGASCNRDSDCVASQVCVAGRCSYPALVCLPQCNSDTECGGALRCDPRDGLCRNAVRSGAPIGAVCTLPASSDAGTDAGSDSGSRDSGGLDSSPDPASDASPTVQECRGFCKGFSRAPGQPPVAFACTEPCTVGAFTACGYSSPSQALSLCFRDPPISALGSAGDQGVCWQLCNCNAECTHPDFVCIDARVVLSSDLAPTGKRGYCGPAASTDGGLEPGIACSSDAGSDAPSDGSGDARD